MNEVTNTEKQDSIEVVKNSKGYTWKIKKYFDGNKMSYDETLDEIRRIDTRLKGMYGEPK